MTSPKRDRPIQTNAREEPKFRRWLADRLRKRADRISLAEAIDCGIGLTDLSRQTIHRYLKKLTSGEGPLEQITDDAGTVWIRRRLDDGGVNIDEFWNE